MCNNRQWHHHQTTQQSAMYCNWTASSRCHIVVPTCSTADHLPAPTQCGRRRSVSSVGVWRLGQHTGTCCRDNTSRRWQCGDLVTTFYGCELRVDTDAADVVSFLITYSLSSTRHIALALWACVVCCCLRIIDWSVFLAVIRRSSRRSSRRLRLLTEGLSFQPTPWNFTRRHVFKFQWSNKKSYFLLCPHFRSLLVTAQLVLQVVSNVVSYARIALSWQV